MAKLNKRQRKKQQKREIVEKQKSLLKQHGYTDVEIKSIYKNTLKSNKKRTEIITNINTKEKAKKRKITRQNRITQKRFLLQDQFPDVMVRGKISDKKIDSIKLADIQNKNINRYNYPFLFSGVETFDFDKIYKLKNGERMFFAFRDFTGEESFDAIIQKLQRYDTKTLLDFLDGIVNTPPSYSKKNKSASSGKAGDYRYECGKQNVITLQAQETYNRNRRKATKNKSVPYPGFQVLKNGRLNSFDEVTPRNLILIANALMYNITELDRIAFYKQFRSDVVHHIPEMNEILPRLE